MTKRTRRRWVVAAALAVVVAAAGTGWWWVEMRPEAGAAVTVALPTDAERTEFAETGVLFGHQSVGANILDGVRAVYASAGDVAPPIVEATPDAAATGPGIRHAFVGVNGDPFGKLEAFRALVDAHAGEGTDVAMLKFCYLDVTASSDPQAVFDAYAATMAELEARHPGIRFLYTTVPVTTDRSWKADLKALFGIDDRLGPADNVVRQHYNTLVRERFGGTGRLFDIAAVESATDAGPMERSHDGSEYVVLNETLSSDAGHLNELGGRAAAAELIRVVAQTRPQ